MSNLEILQKLSNGTKTVENVTIETEDGKYDFLMRPLSDGELTRLQSLEKKPYSMSISLNSNGKKQRVQKPVTDMDVSMGEFTESQAEAMYTAVAWSLSVDGEKITVDAVKNLDKGVPELLFNEVIRLSHLTEDDLIAIKQFRN